MSRPARLLERAGLGVLGRLDPETAHGLALRATAAGFGPRGGPVTGTRLGVEVGGLRLPNPVGIAAGFDKDGVAAGRLALAGPGFVELGAVTPRPQPGNPRPRLFRLREQGAAINRFGFNNAGMETMARRLEALRAAGPPPVPIGLNLGANKDSVDRAADYEALIGRLGGLADFLTINVSSPNTEALRDLQGAAALDELLGRAKAALGRLAAPPVLWLKIAPDLDEAGLDAIAAAALAHGIDAVVATNTTLSRDGVTGLHAHEAGGLSGRPLFARSTQVLRGLHARLGGRVALVGVGGIGSAEDAYAKIRAGARAVQLYTALAYGGLWLARDIVRGLDALLARDGHPSVAAAVGRAGS